MILLKNYLKLILEVIFLIYLLLSFNITIFALASLIIYVLDYKYLKKIKYKYIILLLMCLAYIFLYQQFFFTTDLKNEEQIQIKVQDDLLIKEDYLKFTTTFKNKKYQILYFSKDKNEDIKYGDILNIKIKEIKKIENQFNNKGSFDSVSYFKSKKIRYQIQVQDIKKIKNEANILEKLKNIRNNQIQKVKENVPKNYNLINSLIFGDKIDDENIYNQIKDIGIIQLFTISGFHISFIVIIIEKFLQYFKIQKKHINIISSFILIIYLPLSGSGNSVKRAILMFIIFTYFYYVEKELDKIYIWTMSLIIFLILNPYNLLNIGFILTYLITFFLILNKNHLLTKTIKEKIYFNYFITMFIFPITVNLNNSFNILLPFLLIIYNKLIYLMLSISFLIVLCINLNIMTFLTIFKLLFLILSSIFLILNKLSMLMTIKIHHYSIVFIIIYMTYYLKQLKEYYIFKDRINKHKKQFLIVVILLSVNINLIGTVDIIDIGQGDAIYIQKPLSYNILIDTGPKKSKKELEKFLDYKGVKKIDNIIITHNHEDHQGSLNEILKDYKIGKIYLNKNTYLAFEKEIKKYDYKVIEGTYKNKLGYFYTSKEDIEENNNSIIFMTKLGLNKWLFMGDAQKELEKDLINNFNIDVDYIKIGHHGSKTSTTQEFLDKTTPKEVFISSGRNNKYNHPSLEVIKRLEKNKIKNKDTQFDYQITKYYI